jgi:hypothetical protein
MPRLLLRFLTWGVVLSTVIVTVGSFWWELGAGYAGVAQLPPGWVKFPVTEGAAYGVRAGRGGIAFYRRFGTLPVPAQIALNAKAHYYWYQQPEEGYPFYVPLSPRVASPQCLRWLGVQWGQDGGNFGHTVEVWQWLTLPLWPVPIVGGILLIWCRPRDKDPGLCAKCGYDLRATPDRCPECGTVPAKPARKPAPPNTAWE